MSAALTFSAGVVGTRVAAKQDRDVLGFTKLVREAGPGQETPVRILRDGEPVDLTGAADPADLRARGMAHVPEDRQREGLIMDFQAWENNVFGYHHDDRFNSGLLMNHAASV